jgi:uncharacterized repeat protein (TIGR01451 family)
MKSQYTSRPDSHRSNSYMIVRIGAFVALIALIAIPLFSASAAFFPGRSATKITAPAKEKSGIPSKSGLAFPLLFPQGPPPPPPSISTNDGTGATCGAAKVEFQLGDEVCAQVTSTGGAASRRRITWQDPEGFVRQTTPITTDPQNDNFIIPGTATSTLPNGQVVNNVGKWRVSLVARSLVTFATFVVKDPNNARWDLSITKTASGGAQQVAAGSDGAFNIYVQNGGPDDATTVGTTTITVTDHVPDNTTFVSMTQTSGQPTSSFTCTSVPDGMGNITCSIATFASGASATFSFIYTANTGTPAGTAITNNVSIASAPTHELNNADNSASASVSVTGASSGTCTLDCPENISTSADTTEGGQRGTHVTFDVTSTGDCGAVTATPASGSFFPVGTTVVSVSSETGNGSCSFTVTVNDSGTNPPTISCPANITANADGDCQAFVNIGAPTATGNNVTVVGVRSDGKPLYNCDCFPNSPNQADDSCNIYGGCSRKNPDAPFASGVTTITWQAISHDVGGPYTTPADEEAHRTGTASCTQTITVNDVTPPVITATDSSASADANCQAPIPDYTNQVSDNCACAANDNSQDCVGQHRITVTQNPAAGTMVGLGPHTVHLTANDGSSNNSGAGNTTTKDVTFTVNDTTAPMITCPANQSNIPTEPGTCAAHVNPGTATATDNCDSTPTITASRSDGRPITDTYPRGTTTITWTATDDAGNHSSCTQTITVVDNEPPVIVFNGQTPSMWPPNHKYHTFAVTDFVTSVTDNCDSVSVSSVVITKVTSDELENSGGDGNTLNDIVIASNCKSVQLRSERDGGGNGRVYTIFFSVKDSSNNVGTGTAKVVVQHNPGETAVDSGPHYTVMSSCP